MGSPLAVRTTPLPPNVEPLSSRMQRRTTRLVVLSALVAAVLAVVWLHSHQSQPVKPSGPVLRPTNSPPGVPRRIRSREPTPEVLDDPIGVVIPAVRPETSLGNERKKEKEKEKKEAKDSARRSPRAWTDHFPEEAETCARSVIAGFPPCLSPYRAALLGHAREQLRRERSQADAQGEQLDDRGR
jgi:hypothetical protein